MRAVCLPNGLCDAVPSPASTPAELQTTGDCRVNVCDGQGGVTSAPDDADLADDANGCTSDACEGGIPVFTNRPAGASCAQGGVVTFGAACDGNGQCMGGPPPDLVQQ
jgi:hypothetical protein